MFAIRSTLKTFLGKINSGLVEPKKFSEQSEKYQLKNIQALKNAVDIFSGNEPVAIIQKLLNSPKYSPGLFAAVNQKQQKCLENILQAFNRATNQEEKKFLLSLVTNIYPAKFLKSVGFVFNSNLFSLARKKRSVT